MKEDNIIKYILSGILTSILITFLTIYAEMNEVFKEFLKNAFYHHWVGKGIISIIFFILLAQLIHLKQKKDINKFINSFFIITILCSLAIFIFFFLEGIN